MTRLCNAGLMWLRNEISSGEEGTEKWDKFMLWLNTPPGATPTASRAAPVVPSRADQIKAAAMSRVGDQGAAFAAYAAANT